ncbi:unnamed protein product [Paramecium pentaurelia]|uniref:MSP domain-containing protein n=1 Tax=Paramecium pentaurelia TaxID=43138 RepID=A0A8S1VFS6_9CILI|nr:unnamed protein product [Paramecium pentaurelia]
MEEEHNHLVEITPEKISISLDNLSTSFNILNLTLQYVPYKIISPNPMIFQIQPEEGILDPCDSIDVKITAIITSSLNFQCFEKNNKLTILTQEDSETDWKNVLIENIQRHDILINIIKSTNPFVKIADNVIIAQIYNNFKFTEEEKKIIIEYIMNKYGKTTNYNISNTMMIFRYQNQVQGDVHLIQYPDSTNYFILRTYSPCLLVNTPPKYQLEPMSPQAKKKVKEIEQPQPQQQQQQLQKTPKPKKAKDDFKTNLKSSVDKKELKQQQQLFASLQVQSINKTQFQEEQQIDTNSVQDQQNNNGLNENVQINDDSQQLKVSTTQQDNSINNSNKQQNTQEIDLQKSQQIIFQSQIVKNQQETSTVAKPRYYQSEIIPKNQLDQFKYEKFEQSQKTRKKQNLKGNFQNLAPIQMEQKQQINVSEKQYIEQNPPKFKKIANFNTYSKIQFVVLFKDHSYLITVSDKEVITVWNLNLNSEEGKIRDHSEMKKIRILKVYEWADSYEKKFGTLATDQMIRIFSIEEMRLKYIWKIDDFSEITSIAFLSDKDQVCLAGTPLKQFNIFGSKYPKYRFLRVYNSRTLKEILSQKINANEGQILNPVEYTDNENMKHARLNNILAVNKCYKEKDGGEILFFLVDMANVCTLILTLTYEQIQVWSVKSLYYLPLRGSFVVIERNSPKSYYQNKIFVINVKQLQTDDGLKNGIVCKQFEDSSVLDDEIYVLPRQEQLLKVKGDIVQLIDLKTEVQLSLQISQQMGENPLNMVQSGQIIRIDGENLQILDLIC